MVQSDARKVTQTGFQSTSISYTSWLSLILWSLTLWHPHGFRDFRKKNRLNAHGFAWEFLWSGMLHIPGKSLKRRGKSSSLHSKNIFLLEGCRLYSGL